MTRSKKAGLRAIIREAAEIIERGDETEYTCHALNKAENGSSMLSGEAHETYERIFGSVRRGFGSAYLICQEQITAGALAWRGRRRSIPIGDAKRAFRLTMLAMFHALVEAGDAEAIAGDAL